MRDSAVLSVCERVYVSLFGITLSKCDHCHHCVLDVRAYSVLPVPRDEEEEAMLHRMMRVDHAGEYGANRIYAGQMAVLGRSQTGPLIQVGTLNNPGEDKYWTDVAS